MNCLETKVKHDGQEKKETKIIAHYGSHYKEMWLPLEMEVEAEVHKNK